MVVHVGHANMPVSPLHVVLFSVGEEWSIHVVGHQEAEVMPLSSSALCKVLQHFLYFVSTDPVGFFNLFQRCGCLCSVVLVTT